MSKVTKDDIGAIASRIDAQTIVLIEVLAELKEQDDKYIAYYSDKYAKRYDELAKRFRKNIVS